MFISDDSRTSTSELTHSPRKDRITMAQKTHFGEEFSSYSIPAVMQTRYPRLGSEMASPLPQSRRGRSGSRTFSSKIRRCTRCAFVLPLALVMMSCTLALWYFSTFEKDLLGPGMTLSAPTESGARNLAMSDMCSSRASSVQPVNRAQCASMLHSPVEEEKWLVGVHVDRTPFSQSGLRGSRQHRELPHQYFVRAMEAILYTISFVDPGAGVFIVVFSEGRWGGMVDETGLPVDWDIPREICDEVGLSCTKELVMINGSLDHVTDAVECLASMDVMLSSENDVSRAAAAISSSVKVLTDQWQPDDDEGIVVLNPAATVAGVSSEARVELERVLNEWQECSSVLRATA